MTALTRCHLQRNHGDKSRRREKKACRKSAGWLAEEIKYRIQLPHEPPHDFRAYAELRSTSPPACMANQPAAHKTDAEHELWVNLVSNNPHIAAHMLDQHSGSSSPGSAAPGQQAEAVHPSSPVNSSAQTSSNQQQGTPRQRQQQRQQEAPTKKKGLSQSELEASRRKEEVTMVQVQAHGLGACIRQLEQEKADLIAKHNALQALVGSSEALLDDVPQALAPASIAAGATSSTVQQLQQQQQQPGGRTLAVPDVPNTPGVLPAAAATMSHGSGSAGAAVLGDVSMLSMAAAGDAAMAEMFAETAAVAAKAAVEVDAAMVLQLKELLNTGIGRLTPLVAAADGPTPDQQAAEEAATIYMTMVKSFCSIGMRHPVSVAALETLNLATGFTCPERPVEHWQHVLAAGMLSVQCQQNIVVACRLFSSKSQVFLAELRCC